MSNTGSFLSATDVLYKKALKSLFSLYSSLDVRSDTKNTRLFLKLFDSLVKPVLLYGCEIWGSFASNPKAKSEKFVNKFYRTLLGAAPNSSTAGIHAELGRYPLHVNIQQSMIKYWFRIISLSSDRLAVHCYWSLLELNPTNDPWFNAIQNIINSSGQNFLWNSQMSLSTLDPRTLSRYACYISRTLENVSMQHIHEKINSETKLSFLKDWAY